MTSADSASRSLRAARLPSLRQVLFQLHWFFGITAGTLLIVIGLSGATLAFREEIVDAITPGGRHVAPAATPALSPPQLLRALRAGFGSRPVATLIVSSEAGHAARVIFAPPPGQRRGESIYVDPYTGAALPGLRAEPFFEWVESLHRWLLLPREQGRVVAGILAASLLLLSASGLVLRWPRRALDWRAWLTFDTRLKGRSFLWGLHSVAGTLALVVYLGFTTTGLYWAYDWIRDPVDRMAGEPRPPPQAPRPKAAEPRAEAPPADIDGAWTAFAQRAGDWREAVIRIPAPGARTVVFTWLAEHAPHERARNRMTVKLPGGEISQDDRYADRSASRQALAVIYPLHLGSYFGLPGKIVNTLAALMLPLFAVTGWMLYLDRRRKKREIARQQAALVATPAGAPGALSVLIAFASQTGTAEGIALRSAALLRKAGVAVTLLPFAELDPERLRHFQHLLLVASSFGEGEPPDSARRAARLFAQAASASLAHLHYGLLALGDRHYPRFCGFGHAMDHALESAGATRLFPMVEVDAGDAAALEAWRLALQPLAGGQLASGALLSAADPLQSWQLAQRVLLNPGSQGEPLYRIDLLPPAGVVPQWRAGALVELRPRHPTEASWRLLRQHGFEPSAVVSHAGQPRALAELLGESALPGVELLAAAAGQPQMLADGLAPLAPRRYSVASLPGEGVLRLLVRQARHEGGLGIASGWLTAFAPARADIALRLVDNPAFAPCEQDGPAIFIGNGSGFAGLRSHLLARIAAGHHRNWLVFGERHRAHDAFCMQELEQWRAAGFLPDIDLVFSRDQAERVYVQDRLLASADRLRTWVEQGACVFVCGSLETMAAGVDAALADILGAEGLEDLIAAGRLRRDVY